MGRVVLIEAAAASEPAAPAPIELRPIRFRLQLVHVRSLAVAAAITMLVSMSFLLAPDVHTIEAPLGSTQAVAFELPDGTAGYLSAGSALTFSDTFADGVRNVALKGEASFDVAKTGARFIVHTRDSEVSVLGTEFAVRSWPGDIEPETVVSVLEGRVAVQKRYGSDHPVELTDLQQLRVRDGIDISAESLSATTEQTFSWISGGAEFVNMPIGNVLSELSRRHNVILDAPPPIRDRRITLLPQPGASIEDVLVDMSAAVNVRYRKIAGGFEFYLD